MCLDEVIWDLIEFPVDVADDEPPRSRWLIVHEGIVVAEMTRYGEYDGHEIVKRLNQWEEQERERHKAEMAAVQEHFQKKPLGAEGPTGG